MSPGLIAPLFSAASIIDRPMRSLIEPPGLLFSSFTYSSHGPVSNVSSFTSGVLPIRARIPRAGGGGMEGPVCVMLVVSRAREFDAAEVVLQAFAALRIELAGKLRSLGQVSHHE